MPRRQHHSASPRRLLATALATATLTAAAAAAAAGSPAATPTQAAAAENAFALSLLPKVAPTGNAVYSPYSVAVALSMTAAGARGATQAQMLSALGAQGPAANLANAQALRTSLRKAVGRGPAAPTLDVANSLWTERTLPVERPFADALTTDFGAAPQPTDFKNAPNRARAAINGWVARRTSGIIPALLPDGSITSGTEVVLANAIYLKALWTDPFDKHATKPEPFTTAANTHPTVPFMHAAKVQLRYAGGARFQAVDLPYAASTLSLLAILPVHQSLPALERTLTAAKLDTIARSLRTTTVDLAIPKLHLHAQEPLNAPLEQLGIRDAFTPAADFSGITSAAPLHISLVEHAADLRLDEQGTVAAGATVVTLPTSVVVPQHRPISVNLDRPFLLLLREDASGAILFVARVADPSAS